MRSAGVWHDGEPGCTPRIQLLGRSGVWADPVGGEFRLGPGKPLVLLARLLTETRGASRDTLAALFWPEIDEPRARASLRQALYVIRRTIGDAALLENRRHVALAPAMPCDRSDFLQAIDQGDDARAVRTYVGPFLEGIHMADANDLDRWIDLERQRLARLFVLACTREARRALAAGEHGVAVEVATRLRTLHPDHAAHWELLFDVLAAVGDTRRLEQEFESLAVRLHGKAVADGGRAMALLARFESRLRSRHRLDPQAPEADGGLSLGGTSSGIPSGWHALDGLPMYLLAHHHRHDLPLAERWLIMSDWRETGSIDGQALLRQLLVRCEQLADAVDDSRIADAIEWLHQRADQPLHLTIVARSWRDAACLAEIRHLLARLPSHVNAALFVAQEIWQQVSQWNDLISPSVQVSPHRLVS